ncbi:hypothetical protein [Streptomyces vinaceus]|uniref:hypothetical protein n=1 Tax=Streptomyces vinaceus TaxID=1960 RepID=UPI003688ACD4
MLQGYRLEDAPVPAATWKELATSYDVNLQTWFRYYCWYYRLGCQPTWEPGITDTDFLQLPLDPDAAAGTPTVWSVMGATHEQMTGIHDQFLAALAAWREWAQALGDLDEAGEAVRSDLCLTSEEESDHDFVFVPHEPPARDWVRGRVPTGRAPESRAPKSRVLENRAPKGRAPEGGAAEPSIPAAKSPRQPLAPADDTLDDWVHIDAPGNESPEERNKAKYLEGLAATLTPRAFRSQALYCQGALGENLALLKKLLGDDGYYRHARDVMKRRLGGAVVADGRAWEEYCRRKGLGSASKATMRELFADDKTTAVVAKLVSLGIDAKQRKRLLDEVKRIEVPEKP